MRSWEVITYTVNGYEQSKTKHKSLTSAYQAYCGVLDSPWGSTGRVTLDVVDTSRGYSNRGHLCAQDVVRKRRETA